MNARISLLTLSFLSASACPAVAGQSAEADAITLDPAPSRWRFGAGYAPLLGLKAEFSGLGMFNSAFNARPTGGGLDYDYDDGFVHLDSSGNIGDQTWNWGYDSDSQFDPSGGGSISYTISNSLTDAGARESRKAESGVECFGYLDMGAVGIPMLKDKGACWGFRGGVHYSHIEIGNQAVLTSGITTMTDRFNLGGTIPPLAPFSGSFEGPGPLISDMPARSSAIGGQAVVAGSRDLDVYLTTLSFGAYLAIPVCRSFAVTLEGGVNAGIASGSYDFQSTTTIKDLGSRQSSGNDSGTRMLPGLYMGLSGIYQINESWAIQAAGRYQYMDNFDLEANGSEAILSFDSAFIVSLGVLHTF
jgi:hypothetical protein